MPSITKKQATLIRAAALVLRAIRELDSLPDGNQLANGVRGELDHLALQLTQAVTDDIVQAECNRSRRRHAS